MLKVLYTIRCKTAAKAEYDLRTQSIKQKFYEDNPYNEPVNVFDRGRNSAIEACQSTFSNLTKNTFAFLHFSIHIQELGTTGTITIYALSSNSSTFSPLLYAFGGGLHNFFPRYILRSCSCFCCCLRRALEFLLVYFGARS